MTQHTYIIAEAGVNHNGSLDMALRLVDVAANAGADAVKFQSFRAEQLASRFAPKAEYQRNATGTTESQLEMLKDLELDGDAHEQLAQHCADQGIEFLSTPFDMESLALLTGRLDVPRLKISSGDITNGPLLLAAARSARPVILSTGMSTLEEVEAALAVLAFGYLGWEEVPSAAGFEKAFRDATGQQVLRRELTLLQCTTEYPAPYGEVNLYAMDTLAKTFGVRVGLSDHTLGTAVPIAAVARGAGVIEKHFTLDRTLPGPDHAASLGVEDLRSMIEGIRQVELALGTDRKAPSASEARNRDVVRKSLVALRDIKAGEDFAEGNLGVKRPGGGISPMRYWDLLGTPADQDYKKDQEIG